MADKLDGALAGILPSVLESLGSLDEFRNLQAVIEEQFKISDFHKKNRKKTTVRKTDPDSDEELKAKLENAVRKYNEKIKKEDEPKSIPETQVRETHQRENFNSLPKSFEKETNPYNNRRNGNADAYADIAELINVFFTPRKNRPNIKSYSDYEKEGAIPKGKKKIESKGPKARDIVEEFKLRGKSWEAKLSESIQSKHAFDDHPNGEVVKVSEETCSEPFFYVVPENPSPNFFLPRGSYYVIPSIASSSTYEKIVFHPERGSPTRPVRKDGKKVSKIQSNSVHDPAHLNNLNKTALQKMDSHLNIGPLDVKLNDSTSNLESNCKLNKGYDKSFLSATTVSRDEGEKGSEEAVSAAVLEQLLQDEEKLNGIIQRLMTEFPEMSPASAESFAEKYICDEPGLESFIVEERLKYKMQAQFETMVLALPDSDLADIQRKCNEFKGDEALVSTYIEEARRQNRILRHVMELQNIFPDADPDFLRENVEELNGNENELDRFTERLLENGNYPKISDEPPNAVRKRLWNKYVENFSVKNFLREVPNPQDFSGQYGNNRQQDMALVFKYLQAKYPHQSSQYLQFSFTNANNNLTRTCEALNLTETVGPWKSTIQNEAFTEGFLKEICYIEHRREIDQYLKEMRERKEMEIEEARINDCFLVCPLCANDELVPSCVVTCPEGHVFCTDCIKRYITVRMGDGVYKFACPSEKCETFFMLNKLEDLLPETSLLNIIRKQQAEEISTAEVEGLETCPFCEFAYIPNPGDKIFKCQNSECLMETCRSCHEKNHIPLRCEEVERPIDVEARKRIEETMSGQLIRICPKCRKKIVKIDGCNKMQCSCGALFCYVCRKAVSGYDHFKRGPFGQGTSMCPLYSNNEELHNRAVIQAGIQARDEILRENPKVRVFYDPAKQ